MTKWLSKKDYERRTLRIIELREKKHLTFAYIAEAMSVPVWTVMRSYREAKKGR